MRGVSYPPNPRRPRSPLLAGLVFLASLLPGLVALLPRTLGTSWYLTDDGNASDLSAGRVWFLQVLFAIAIAPFLAVVVSFTSPLLAGRDLAVSFRIAAGWAGGLGLIAFAAAGVRSGGF